MVVNTPSILITDDDLGFRETLQDVFEPKGYRTYLAGDGAEALDIVQREEVHLILLDLHMPKLSGLEVIRQIKQIDAILPCILMSADLNESLVRQAEMLRAFSVLAKPVTSRQITGIVQMALRSAYDWPCES